MPLLFQMTVCMDIRVVVPGAWVAFSYSSVHAPRPELGLEGDDGALYGWLLRVRHRFPLQLSLRHWHRVCLRRDVPGNSFSLEVDGKIVAERTVIAQAIPPSGSLWLGCRPRDRPPGAVLGEVEVYLFRMWADLSNHGFCEDGTVIGWNAHFWGLTSPNARQKDLNLPCEHKRLKRGADGHKDNDVLPASQLKTESCSSEYQKHRNPKKPPDFTVASAAVTMFSVASGEAHRICDCNAFCNFANFSSGQLTSTCNTGTGLYSCMAIMGMCGSANNCTLSKRLQQLIGSNNNITNEKTLTRMGQSAYFESMTNIAVYFFPAIKRLSLSYDLCSVLCGPPGLPVHILLVSNLTWVTNDLLTSDTCQPGPTLLKYEANETLAVLLNGSCPLRPLTTNTSTMHPSTQTKSNITTATPPTVTNTTHQTKPPETQQKNASQERTQPNVTTPFSMFNSIQPTTAQPVLQTSSHSKTVIVSDNTTPQNTTSSDNATLMPPTENIKLQNTTIAQQNTSSVNNLALQNTTTIRMNSTLITTAKSYNATGMAFAPIPSVTTVYNLTTTNTFTPTPKHMTMYNVTTAINNGKLHNSSNSSGNPSPNHTTEYNVTTATNNYTTEYDVTTATNNFTAEYNVTTATNKYTTEYNVTTATNNFTAEYNVTTAPNSHTTEYNVTTATNNYITEYNVTTAPNSHTTEYNVTTATNNFTAEYNVTTATNNYTTEYNVTTATNNFTAEYNVNTPPNNYTTEYNVTTAPNSHTTEYNVTTATNIFTAEYNVTTPPNNYTTEYNVTTAPNSHTAEYNVTTATNNFTAEYNVTTATNKYTTEYNVTTATNNFTAEYNVNTPPNNYTTEYNVTTATNYFTAEYNVTTAPNSHTTEYNVTTATNIFTAEYNVTTATNNYTTEYNVTTENNNYTKEYNVTTATNTFTAEYNVTTVTNNFTAEYNVTTATNNYTTEYNVTTVTNNFTAEYNVTTATNNYTTEYNVTTATNNFTGEYNVTTATNNFTGQYNVTTATNNYTTENATTAISNRNLQNSTSNATVSTFTTSPNYTTVYTVTTAFKKNTTISNNNRTLHFTITSNATNSTLTPSPNYTTATTIRKTQQNTTVPYENTTMPTTVRPVNETLHTTTSTNTSTMDNKTSFVYNTIKTTVAPLNQTTNYTTASVPHISTTTNRNYTNSTLTTAANTSLEHISPTSTLSTTASTAHGPLPTQDTTTTAMVSFPTTTTTTTLQTTTLTSTTDTTAGTGMTTTTTEETPNSTVAQEEQADAVLDETQDASLLNSSQITQLVGKLEKLLDGPTVSQTAGKTTINIVSKLMQSDSQALSASANRLIRVMDILGLKLAVTGDRVILSSNSLVLAVRTVDGTNFPTISVNIFNTSNVQDAALKKQTLVSPVLGSSVANMSMSNLKENIQFTIRNTNPVHDLSRQGITDRQQALVLTFITYIGCGVSTIFLAVTILTYLSFKKLFRDIPAKIHVQLCMSLLLLNLVYLLDGWLARYLVTGLCISTAFFLHYFLLTSFTWSGLEALHMYLSIIQVFTPYLSRYMLKFSLIGWGIPLIVVIVVISVDKDNYGLVTYGKYTDGTSDNFCWLQNNTAFYVGVVAYALLIFALCLMVFIIVMVQLARIKKKNPQNQSPNRGVMTDLRSIAGLVVLLGLTWGFALFAWGPLYLPFVYLFSIFNSLYGFFVFIFHCAIKENVRRQWRTYLCCGKLRLAENSGGHLKVSNLIWQIKPNKNSRTQQIKTNLHKLGHIHCSAEWSRMATQNNRHLSVATPAVSVLHLTSRSSSVISDSTNSSGFAFADSGISNRSNSDVALNELHR
ncbi:hypothetical protein PAMP_010966 [Pampus punctatissimus]